MSQTFAPTATYGSNAVKNRVKIGGALGSNQYFYKTNAKTGTVEINRYETDKSGKVTETSIGSVAQGGKFVPSSGASSAEKTYYNSPQAIGKVRQQALQIARREWDGKTQPPPHQAIYGTNSPNIGYTPPGAGTPNSSSKGVQDTGYSSDTNTFSNVAKSALKNSIRDIANRGSSNILGGFFGKSGKGGSGVVVYPVTLRQSGNSQDCIKIQKLEYAPKSRSGTGLTGWSERSISPQRIRGSIILPIPGGISDTNAVSWSEDQMTPAETAMANLALTGIEGGGEAMAKEIGNLGKNIKEGKEDVKKAISTGIAGMASGTGAQLLTRTSGQIMNPNMELLFKNPTLRPFNFTWKLAARSEDEANAIIKIIHFFKKGMAPQNSESGLFLKSPHTWKLTYLHKGSPHKYINQIKECAMTSLTTQYTPDGNYATFETGHMVAYSITMGLQELEPVFSRDYGNDNEIGF